MVTLSLALMLPMAAAAAAAAAGPESAAKKRVGAHTATNTRTTYLKATDGRHRHQAIRQLDNEEELDASGNNDVHHVCFDNRCHDDTEYRTSLGLSCSDLLGILNMNNSQDDNCYFHWLNLGGQWKVNGNELSAEDLFELIQVCPCGCNIDCGMTHPPTISPAPTPIASKSVVPTQRPTSSPTTVAPTAAPSSKSPSPPPTRYKSRTFVPTSAPSAAPVSTSPTIAPTIHPSSVKQSSAAPTSTTSKDNLLYDDAKTNMPTTSPTTRLPVRYSTPSPTVTSESSPEKDLMFPTPPGAGDSSTSSGQPTTGPQSGGGGGSGSPSVPSPSNPSNAASLVGGVVAAVGIIAAVIAVLYYVKVHRPRSSLSKQGKPQPLPANDTDLHAIDTDVSEEGYFVGNIISSSGDEAGAAGGNDGHPTLQQKVSTNSCASISGAVATVLDKINEAVDVDDVGLGSSDGASGSFREEVEVEDTVTAATTATATEPKRGGSKAAAAAAARDMSIEELRNIVHGAGIDSNVNMDRTDLERMVTLLGLYGRPSSQQSAAAGGASGQSQQHQQQATAVQVVNDEAVARALDMQQREKARTAAAAVEKSRQEQAAAAARAAAEIERQKFAAGAARQRRQEQAHATDEAKKKQKQKEEDEALRFRQQEWLRHQEAKVRAAAEEKMGRQSQSDAFSAGKIAPNIDIGRSFDCAPPPTWEDVQAEFGPESQPSQPSAPPSPPAEIPRSPVSMKYEKMKSEQSFEADQVVITRIKREILIHWALAPPQYMIIRPIHQLLLSIHHSFPPAFGVAPHHYFLKWQPVTKESISMSSAMGGAPDEEKLKKAVKKIRFFLHPDKLPRDLDAIQSFVCRMLWDITSDSWEEHRKKKDELDWFR